MIAASLVKELRQRTGAGMMDCKRALEAAGGDLDKAIDHLRTTGVSKADEKSHRDTGDGIVVSYIHPGSKLGVLVEVNCETDFMAKTEEFQTFVKDVAMHIAATAPMVVNREDISPAVLEHEKGIFVEQARQAGKPDHILEKIVAGKVDKFLSENVLLEQGYVKDPQKTIGDYLKESVARMGENISIARFSRFQLGETDPANSGA